MHLTARVKKIYREYPQKNIRKGDRVLVIAGNEKGKVGQVLRVQTKFNRLFVQGVNIRKKHVRPTQQNPKGGYAQFEGPIATSNVVICDENKRPLKLQRRISPQGDKELVYYSGEELVVYRTLKKKSAQKGS